MTASAYIDEISRQLREVYAITGDLPNGVFPMRIDGRVDLVTVHAGRLSCCHHIDQPGELEKYQQAARERFIAGGNLCDGCPANPS